MKNGENSIKDSLLSVSFKHFYQGLTAEKYVANIFTITPRNFSVGMPVKFGLKYVFNNAAGLTGSSQIAFSLSTENGTTLCDGKYNEGDVQRKLLNVGRMTRLTIVVNKRQYLPDSRKCRYKPYAEILNENVLKNIYNRCPVPCKPADTKFDYCQALRMSKEIDQLPNCRKDTNARCFQESYEITQEHLRNFSGPCTKLDYKVETRADSLSSGNEARFQVYFDPPRVAVSEEYLIFDLVAMVSAIGGTLGLCIGFSFTDVISSALKFMEGFALILGQEKQ